jgi:hypothetical protein
MGHQNPSDGGGGSPEDALASLAGEQGDPFKTMGASGGETLSIEDFAAAIERAEAHRRSPVRHTKPLDIDRESARLRYLCRLIARDRQGFCPVNGILLVLPMTAASPNNRLDELAAACKADLSEAFQVFQMRCPVVVLVSDLEKLEGFSTLVERLPSGQAAKKLGQRFPLVPDVDNGEVPGLIEASVSWIGDSLFPSMVYSLFKVETPGGEDIADLLKANSQLYRFLAQLRDRHGRMARLVKESIPGVSGEPILYGGCYFAGTGVEPATGQAFTSGVLMRLIQDQDHVTWTSDSLAADRSFLRLARALKVVLLSMIWIGITLIVGLIAWRLLFSSTEPPRVDAADTVSRNPAMIREEHHGLREIGLSAVDRVTGLTDCRG